VFFDHESGPRVELASFDVFVDLALGLAKKGLLLSGPDDPTFDDLYEDARGVGAAKMAAKERKAALARISALRYPAGDEAGALALALPLAKHYAADIELWQAVTRSAEALGQWELVASAAAKVLRLERPTERHTYCGARVFALHMLGRDDEALAVLSQVLRGLDSPISVGMAIPGHNQRDLMAVQSPKTAAFQRRCLALWTELEPTDVEAWKARSTYSLDDAEWRSCLEKVVALLDEQLQREPIFGADAAKASRRDALEQLDRARGTRSIARPKVVLHRLGEWPIGEELLALLRSAGATEDALGAWHYFHVRDDEDLLAHLEESHRHPEMEDRLMAVSDVLATTYGRFPTLARSFALTCGFHWSATEAELTKAFETAGYTVVRTTDWLASTPIPDADRDALPAKLRAIVSVSYS
jgi:tetratricopeptide (TPR) repeat protein